MPFHSDGAPRQFKAKPNLPPEPPVKSRVSAPAIGLMVTAGIWILLLLMFIAFDAFCLATGQTQLSDRPTIPGKTVVTIRLVFSVVILAINTFIAFGALCMLKVKHYDVAFAAAVMAVIPCCGPCYIIGVPFGIWAIVLLKDPKVEQAFKKGRRR